MLLTTQYYRPPFPDRSRWRDDLAQIRSTGFDAIYVSAVWSWIEPEPGVFVFDDFDELLELAHANELGVILNVWSEIQPLWIHREVPGSELVDHMGRPVASSQLAYMQFGLTPGGCTDHPEVRTRAGPFIGELAARYADAPALRIWDCWNEIRWATQADGFVCYCDHTVRAFRYWLRERYGDLDGLNRAWRRRYRTWDDVQPVKLPTRTYTDALAFQAFLADRASADLRWRRDAIRAADPAHPIVAHAAFPSVFSTGEFFEWEQPLARGNDWDLAEQVDGYGASHFPAWMHGLPSEYGARLESARSAAGAKTYWVSELQGGAAGHGMQAMEPVPGARQSRWVWNAVARGAKGVNFWCWRDEVFGRESGGFGIVGDDGHRDDRLLELGRTAGLFARHGELLDAYRPAQARVGVVFEPTCYSLDWAATLGGGLGSGPSRFQAGHSLQGYLLALERLQIPYDVLEPARSTDLSPYGLIALPWPLVVDPRLAERLVPWIEGGGTLVVESWLDAFDADGLYRYPGERPFAQRLGLTGAGRRPPAEDIPFDGGALGPAVWVESLDDDGTLLVQRRLGAGTIVAVGSFPGLAYHRERYPGFERFLAGLAPPPEIICDPSDGEVIQWRLGSGLLFVLNEGDPVRATFRGHALPPGDVVDLTTDEPAGIVSDGALTVDLGAGRYHVFRLGV